MSLGALGGGGGFYPGAIPNIHAWYDMDQEAYNDGDAVSTIAARDNSFNHALTQATGASQPTFKKGANGIGGRNALSFDGGDDIDYQVRTSTLTAMTVFFAFRTGTDVTTLQTLLGSPNFANNNEVDFQFGSSLFKVYAGSTVTAGAIVASTNYVATYTLNGAASVIRANGVSTTVSATPGTQNLSCYQLGRNPSASARVTAGTLIAEMVSYSRVLSDVEIVLVELYLRRKYGI